MKHVITVSLPEELVWKLNRLSKRSGIPRSRLIENSILFHWLPRFDDMHEENPVHPEEARQYLETIKAEYTEAING